MFTDAMTLRVMAEKYRRLAQQQINERERAKYRAYARIYSEMALQIEQKT
jgi:hypothetical protein